MANNIASGLKRAVILKSAMEAFKHRLVSLGLFSTVFRDVPLEGTNDIEVPYYPLETAASKDYDGSYKFDEGDLESRKVTVNRRKYQSLTQAFALQQNSRGRRKAGGIRGLSECDTRSAFSDNARARSAYGAFRVRDVHRSRNGAYSGIPFVGRPRLGLRKKHNRMQLRLRRRRGVRNQENLRVGLGI